MDETLIHACASTDIENYPVEPEYLAQFEDSQSNELEIGLFIRQNLH